jgi:hypothetical protein
VFPLNNKLLFWVVIIYLEVGLLNPKIESIDNIDGWGGGLKLQKEMKRWTKLIIKKIFFLKKRS